MVTLCVSYESHNSNEPQTQVHAQTSFSDKGRPKNVRQSHPLHRMCFSQYHASLAMCLHNSNIMAQDMYFLQFHLPLSWGQCSVAAEWRAPHYKPCVLQQKIVHSLWFQIQRWLPTVHEYLTSTVHEYLTSTEHEYLTSTEHEYLTSTEHEYLTSTEHEYLTSTEHEYLTSTEHEYLTSTEHEYLTSTEHEYLTSTEHGYLTSTE